LVPLIYDTDHSIYKDHGINFMGVSHLESLGLVHLNNISGYVRRGLAQKGFVYYFGNKVWVGFHKPDNNELQLGHVLLTKAGQQLGPICGAQPRTGFVDYVKEKWKSLGYKTEPDPEQSPAAGSVSATEP
jgi:hypothetical protein